MTGQRSACGTSIGPLRRTASRRTIGERVARTSVHRGKAGQRTGTCHRPMTDVDGSHLVGYCRAARLTVVGI